MTSWIPKAALLLLVFVCMIYLSHGGCHDYFEVKEWKQHLLDSYPLVNSAKSEDMMECSLERAVIKDENTDKSNMLGHILRHCFNREGDPRNISEKCQGDTSETVPFYHFMCLTADAFNKHKDHEADKIKIEGCKYDAVCRLISKEPLPGSHQTTILPQTATLPETTSETTVLPPTTITTALPLKVTSAPIITTTTTTTPTTTAPPTTTTPETTPPPTTTAPPTTAAPPTTTPETTPPPPATPETTPPPTTNFSQNNAEASIDREKENLALKIFSVVSAAFNMVLFMVMLYRCKRNQRMQDCNLSITTHLSEEASLEAQPMAELKLRTMRVNEDREVTKHLMQSRDSISTQSELVLNEE